MTPVNCICGKLRLRRQPIKNVKVLRIIFDRKTAHSRNGMLKGGEYVGILMTSVRDAPWRQGSYLVLLCRISVMQEEALLHALAPIRIME